MKKLYLILSILLLSIGSFAQSRTISTTTKKIVFTRDGGICKCCGSNESLEYDHIIPFSCGGTNGPSNIQLLCRKCNRSKSNSCYCKVHNKKVGNNCCDKGTNVAGSSKSTSTSSSQCTGITKSGTRCKKMTRNSNGRCYLHG